MGKGHSSDPQLNQSRFSFVEVEGIVAAQCVQVDCLVEFVKCSFVALAALNEEPA